MKIFLIGLAGSALWLIYLCLFNWLWSHSTNSELDLIGTIVMSTIAPLILLLFLSIPFFIGKQVIEIFSVYL